MIVFITDNIAIGDTWGALGDKTLAEQGINAVLNVSQAYFEVLQIPRSNIPLVNGPGNSLEEFARAVDEVGYLLERDLTILVHCITGRSRSATVVATHLARERSISFDEAVEIIRQRKSDIAPNPALIELAEEILNA